LHERLSSNVRNAQANVPVENRVKGFNNVRDKKLAVARGDIDEPTTAIL
jgi:hypothetical protein